MCRAPDSAVVNQWDSGMQARLRFRLMCVVALAGCAASGDLRKREPEVLVVTDQNRNDVGMLGQPEYRSLRGAAPGELAGSEPWKRRAIANALLTDYYRNRESEIYRSRDANPQSGDFPRLCLALSGGGMRALAFSTGVLHGLQRTGVYPKVDIVSSVSGGAYVSYWTLSHLRKGASEAQILSGPDSEQLTRLRQHANGLTSPTTKGLLLGVLGGAPPTDEWSVAARLIGTAVGAFQIKLAPGNVPYGMALHRMLTDSRWMLPSLTWVPRFGELVKSGQTALPIWLTTARPAGETSCVGTDPEMEIRERSRSLLWSAFEISPLRMGSEELGFLSPTYLDARDALAASGAAMNLPYIERCALLTLIDSSLLMHNYPAPGGPVDMPAAERRFQPTLPDFHLIDGGLADNLAVYPLVRRLCNEIIVVDAEFDPYLVFQGYGYLKQQLAALDIVREVPEVEALAARNRFAPTPGDSGAPCYDGLCYIRPKPECIVQDASANCAAADSLTTSILRGRIGPMPIATPVSGDAPGERWTFEERTLRVHYVKLALDAASIDAYPATVRERYAEHAERRQTVSEYCVATRDSGACSFPHEPTVDLDFRDGQFEAYWDLGRCTIERFWRVGDDPPTNARCADSVWPAID